MDYQCYKVFKPGSLNKLKFTIQKLGKPGKGEVTVQVKAIGLNYADIFAIMGLYSATPKDPFIPGLEYAGIVAEVGEGVQDFKAGDKVMGVTRFGGYTEVLNIDHRYIITLPEGWSFEEGAAFPVQVLTAYYGLVTLGNLQHGQSVLIHSAAGGVGLLANRIAKKMGAYTIGVVGNESKFDILKKEGYDRFLIRSNKFKKDVTEALAGRELNLVMETTGDKFFHWSYDLLAPMGRVISYGSAQFTPSGQAPFYPLLLFKYLFRPRVDPLSMIKANKSLMAFNLIWLYEKADIMKELLNDIFKLNLEAPIIGRTYEFNKLPQALIDFKAGGTIGKLIVKL
ncbi:beta-ketoacyl-acyl-carrier-protein synthase I [Sporocytophaga myxococcoides]|uniref:Beta-ketoacyl-acyl-carrier-protein synthase I n=1 Tax=Sporocytophaga myxococcoides TaxID=153721 RepID=A0A098LK25_9BACT|nr:zinc-binding dehydrogenase [Sporocytophaga myxococcoides]GAL86543.1 beta-ketoacyl-acyl-carrier-protein synthase I [Sporocytophaga myxococcoides]